MIIGIDPGQTGALALLSDGVLIGVEDVPTFKTGGKTQINHAELARIIDVWAVHVPAVYIERVGAMPKQGVSSTFKFGAFASTKFASLDHQPLTRSDAKATAERELARVRR